MKDVKPITDSGQLPKHAIEAMSAFEASLAGEDVIYCGFCDGLRKKQHECFCVICQAGKDGCKCFPSGNEEK